MHAAQHFPLRSRCVCSCPPREGKAVFPHRSRRGHVLESVLAVNSLAGRAARRCTEKYKIVMP